jgi:hypothetical protein
LTSEAFVDAAMPWLIAEAEALEKPILESIGPSGAPWPVEHFDAGVFRRIAPQVQQRVSTLEEVPGMVDFLFLEHPIIDKDALGDGCCRRERQGDPRCGHSAYESCEFEPEELHRVTGELQSQLVASLRKRKLRSA